jgi:hypothetical protein
MFDENYNSAWIPKTAYRILAQSMVDGGLLEFHTMHLIAQWKAIFLEDMAFLRREAPNFLRSQPIKYRHVTLGLRVIYFWYEVIDIIKSSVPTICISQYGANLLVLEPPMSMYIDHQHSILVLNLDRDKQGNDASGKQFLLQRNTHTRTSLLMTQHYLSGREKM